MHLQGLPQERTAGNADDKEMVNLGGSKPFPGLSGQIHPEALDRNLDGGSHFIKSGDFYDFIQSVVGEESLELGVQAVQGRPAGHSQGMLDAGPVQNRPTHLSKSTKMALGKIDEVEAEQYKESEVRVSVALAPIQSDPRPDHHRSSLRSPREDLMRKLSGDMVEENPMLARSEPMRLRNRRQERDQNGFGNELGMCLLNKLHLLDSKYLKGLISYISIYRENNSQANYIEIRVVSRVLPYKYSIYPN